MQLEEDPLRRIQGVRLNPRDEKLLKNLNKDQTQTAAYLNQLWNLSVFLPSLWPNPLRVLSPLVHHKSFLPCFGELS